MSDAQTGQGAVGGGSGAPLRGKRVLVTRTPASAKTIAAALKAQGAEVLIAATTAIVDIEGDAREALVAALVAAAEFDWIFFSSANGVRACERYLRAHGHDMRVLDGLAIAAMGDATADALAACGLPTRLRARGGGSDDLARKLLALAGPRPPRVLFPRARDGREEAVEVLRAAGCEIVLHPAYASTIIDASDPAWVQAAAELHSGKLHAVAFFAPSQVAALLKLDPSARAALAKLEVIAAIGATTAAALEEAGLHANAVASAPTSEDLVDKILQAFS